MRLGFGKWMRREEMKANLIRRESEESTCTGRVCESMSVRRRARDGC